MNFRVNKYKNSRDPLIGSIRSEIAMGYGKIVKLVLGTGISGNGDGATSDIYCGLVASPDTWRVVGIGGWVHTDGLATTAEICQWGTLLADLGSADIDAFGDVTMDTDAGDNWAYGDILYHGITPYNEFFGFDALKNGGEDTWDISGAGAGVLMGEWQTKASFLQFRKANVANADAKIVPFFLVEYESGNGVV
jgi:hypothetical protein